MTDTIRALWDSIDKAPLTDRVGRFIGSLPVIADAYRDAGDQSRADFAAWLYEVLYTKNRGTGVKVQCVPAKWKHRYDPYLSSDARSPAEARELASGPWTPLDRGPALWNVTGLQPYVWKKLPVPGRERLRKWPKKNVSACRLFYRLYAWVRPEFETLLGRDQ